MRNTVFKTAALAGLFLCMLMLAGAFSGITASVHASTASEVQTEEDLKQFVKAAIDEYYINTIIKQHCDFSQITVEFGGQSLALSDLIALQYPNFLNMPANEIRPLVGLFSQVGLNREALEQGCDFSDRFDEVFGRGEGDWKSGSIYLFILDGNGNTLYNGDDPEDEGMRVVAVDEGERNVREEILAEVETPMNAGIVKYCWEDPGVDGDEILDNNPETAPGDSLKVSYVVNPFVDLGAPGLAGSTGVIFGSGIYPGMDSNYPECDGNGMPDGGEEMEEMMEEEEMEEMEEPMEEPMEEAEDVEDVIEDVVDSVSGGGCAIAAGSDSTPRSDALNLLLIVSALLFTVSFGNRAVGRRNGNSS